MDTTHHNMVEAVQYRGVRFSRQDVILLSSGGTVLARLPVGAVRNISVARGFTSERPFFQALIGGLMATVGVIWLFPLITGTAGVSGKTWVYYLTASLVLALMGVFLLVLAVKRGPYLAVTTDRDTRRFPLEKGASAAELRAFLESARQLGYAIDFDGLDAAFPEASPRSK